MKSFELWEHTEYASVCIRKRWEDEVKEEYRDMNPGDTRIISEDDQKIVHIDCVSGAGCDGCPQYRNRCLRDRQLCKRLYLQAMGR